MKIATSFISDLLLYLSDRPIATGSITAGASGAAWTGLAFQTTYGVSTVAPKADVAAESGFLNAGQRPLRSSLQERYWIHSSLQRRRLPGDRQSPWTC